MVEKTILEHHTDIGVGAIPCDHKGGLSNIWDIADIVVKQSDWHDLHKHTWMNQMKGIAMDTKRNLFYSSQEYYFSNAVSGVYQSTYDGKRRFIREWNSNSKIEMFGMAADDSGFLFSLQKDGSGSKCLYKFHHEIDLEDIKAP